MTFQQKNIVQGVSRNMIKKRSGYPLLFFLVPPARLEHATCCSASKRSNPLSYEGRQGGILTLLDTLVKSPASFHTNNLVWTGIHEVNKLWHNQRVKMFARLAFNILKRVLF